MRLTTRTARPAVLAASLAVLLAACGSPQNAVSKLPEPPAKVADPSARAPINVNAVPDTARAVSASLPLTGGTITATASDGSRFTLLVPDGALTAPTTITVTPLSGLEGSPFSRGLVAGVQLQPDGLRFAAPARLTIEPAREVPAERQVPFAYSGGGSDFRFMTLRPGTQGIAYDIAHFSGYGVAEGGPAERRTLANSLPDDPEGRVQHVIGEILEEKRQAELAGLPGDPQYGHKIAVELLRYYQERILPDLKAARTSCYTAANAIPRALDWARAAILLVGDMFDDEIRTIHAEIAVALKHCWEELTQPCVLMADQAQVQVALALARQAALLGYEGSLGDLKACGWEGTVSITQQSSESTTTSSGMHMTTNDSSTALYTIERSSYLEALQKGQNSRVTVKAEFSNTYSQTQNSSTQVGCPKGLSITYTTVNYSHSRSGTTAGSAISKGGGHVASSQGRLSVSLYPGDPIPTITKDQLQESVSGTCNGTGDYSRSESTDLHGEFIAATADFTVDFDSKKGTASGSETKEAVVGGGKVVTTTKWNLTQVRKP